jgi:hypothetical protein
LRKDPHIRNYNAPPPRIPWSLKRFDWPDRYDADVERIRNGVQNEGLGLFVLRTPDNRKAIVEAYYPELIKPRFYETMLDPARQDDLHNGVLVVVDIWRILDGPIDGKIIDEIRRNNRNFRSDYFEVGSSHSRKLELQRRRDEREMNQPEVRRFLDAYADAGLETNKLRKPRNTSTRRIAA